MDKKVGVSLIFSLLFLVWLIGLTFAADSNSADDANDMLRSANITIYGDGFSNESYTKGGTSEIVNVTVTYGSSGPSGNTVNNITNITITWVGNATIVGFTGFDDTNAGVCMDQGAGGACEPDNTSSTAFSNVTIMGGNVGDWKCFNTSATAITCNNNTDFAALQTDNSSITIRFNVTASSNIEDIIDWNITASVLDQEGDFDINSTIVNTYVDGLAPKITNINITDGNITLYNGTGNSINDFILNDSWRFDIASDLYVFATINDLTADGLQNSDGGTTLWLFYNTTQRPIDENLTALGNSGKGSIATVAGNASIVAGTVVDSWKPTSSNALNTQSALVRWIIPATALVDVNTTIFQFLLNDSYDQGKVEGDGSRDGDATQAFKVSINSTVIKIGEVNITDNTNPTTRSDLSASVGNTTYIATGNLTFTVELIGSGLQNVTVYYNETGSFENNTISLGAPFINGDVPSFSQEYLESSSDYPVINLTQIDATTTGSKYYTINLDMESGNTTNILALLVVANATFDDPIRTSDYANYSVIGGPYYVTLDSTLPAAELNTPTTRGIGTADSIEYTCTGTDDHSGVAKYTWYLKKPGTGSSFEMITETTKNAPEDKKKFSGNEIGAPGTYTVRCRVTDNVGNYKEVDTTSVNDFTVSVSSAGGGAAGAGAGGAGAAVSFDVDFTTSPQATFKASQGRVKSFSFDGVTKHTITFNEVASDSVTLVIASDPITVILNSGQSKSIDVNADGTNDMKVQLNGVENDVADVTVTKLEEGAAKVKAEEEQARGAAEAGEEGREVTPVAGRSLAWLWWTLIVIVAIVAIGYYVNKRK